jgi:hypothetical protein
MVDEASIGDVRIGVTAVDSRLVFPRFWLGLRPAVILAVLIFEIVQFRGDSLTTNRREWTRMDTNVVSLFCQLVSIRGSFFLAFGWAYVPL